jgi:2,3-bisphosphoglycerate-dependent phosphoglycerate mutase
MAKVEMIAEKLITAELTQTNWQTLLETRTTRIILVRHGESMANKEKYIGGPDTPLSQLGHEQAMQAGQHINSLLQVHHIISSPFTRALQTAHHIARAVGYPHDIELDHHVQERDFGPDYESGEAGQLQKHPEYMLKGPKGNRLNPDFRPRGGESLTDVRDRVQHTIHRIAQQHQGKNVVIATHGHTVRGFHMHFTGDVGKNVKNCEIRVYEL